VAQLLERERPLEMLAEGAAEAAAGTGRLVFVGGEAGIGKTSLIRALRDRLGDKFTFLIGACEPLSVPVPLGPVRELVEAAGAEDPLQLESNDRLLLVRAWEAALEPHLPAVAVIEDAHWADPLTLDLVRLLVRRLERLPVALILTFREDEVAANPPLRLLLGDLASAPGVTRIQLHPLTPNAVQELAGPTGLDGVELARVTGGNPFLVVETLASGGQLPASVRDAALARAGRLSLDARKVVDAAAVIGQRVDPGLLEAVAPGSGERVEEALARGVLLADEAGLGFRHELIREAIEESISPSRRAALHARVLEALGSLSGSDNARLAHHAELAGSAERAARYAIAAADDAWRLGAVREVALQSDRALRLGSSLSDSERVELLIQCSHAHNFSSRHMEDAVPPAEEAIELATQIGDASGHGRALIALSYALWSLDRVTEAKRAADQAVAVLEPCGDAAALAHAHATRIRIEATQLDPAAAIAHAPRALELAASAALEETRIDVTISLGLARGHRGEIESLEILREACRQAARGELPIRTVRSYVNQVFVGVLLRQHDFVDATTDEAQALFEEYGTPIPSYAIQLFRARSLLDRGRFEEALTIAKSRPDWFSETAIAWTIEGLVGARRGEPRARDQLRQAWRELEHVPETSRHGTVRVALAEAAWLLDDRPDVMALHRQAEGCPAAGQFARTAGELALWAWRCGLDPQPPTHMPLPVSLELAGDWRGAIGAWMELEAPYEASLAALPGDAQAARRALATLQRLGAQATARAFARERAARGAPTVRGARRTTLANPAGLTRREQEVLEALATGASNPDIAQTLHLSQRTVAHHVSAILSKLGVGSRVAAIETARARGLLSQDGPVAGQR
jgi:DNA-binding CsgD family transcriptional regulator/tetratricopeptide (TPR) repeat protein